MDRAIDRRLGHRNPLAPRLAATTAVDYRLGDVGIAPAVMTESVLSFLGVGVQPPPKLGKT